MSTEDTRPPLHGATLLMALPVFRKGTDTPKEFCVLIKRDSDTQPYINAWVTTLDDPTWSNGHYFSNLEMAMGDTFARANIVPVGGPMTRTDY